MKNNNSIFDKLQWSFLLFGLCCGLIACSKQTSEEHAKYGDDGLKEKNEQGAIIKITPKELNLLLLNDQNVFLVDIRQKEELLGSYPKLKNAVNINKEIIYNNPDTLPKNKSIIIMCKTGHRSTKLATFLKNKGRLIYNLKGGLKNYYHWQKDNGLSNDYEIPETEQDLINDGGC